MAPKWLLSRAKTIPVPDSRAISIAASSARMPTSGPTPRSPSSRAMVGATRSIPMSGRAFAPPARTRSAYDSMRLTPCVWTPNRSPITRMRAQSSASLRGMPSASSAATASAVSSSSRTAFKRLVRLDAGGLDHLAPGVRLLADVRGDLFARAGARLEAVLEELLAHVGRVEHLHQLAVPAIEDLRRRLAGSDEGIPVGGLEAGIAALVDGGHVGERRRAREAGDRERTQLPGLDVRQHGRRRRPVRRDAA